MKIRVLLISIFILIISALPVVASIGDALWSNKCPAEASVIVTELSDGTNLVECFLYIERENGE